jgi:hypothetical protein
MKPVRQWALSLGAILLFGSVCEAQNYVHSIVVTVKSSSVQEFEDYAKKVLAAAAKVGSPQRFYALQVIAGGPQFTYLFSSPFSSYEEMGGWSSIPEMLMKANGDVEGAKILKAGRATIETSETRVTRTLSELSTNMKPYDPPSSPFIRLVRTEVDPAMTGAYEEYLAKLRAAQEKESGYPPTTRRVTALGKAAVYSSATYLKTAAELDRIPNPIDVMRKAYGDEGARSITGAGNGAIRSREVWLLRYRPDLSRPTIAPPTN